MREPDNILLSKNALTLPGNLLYLFIDVACSMSYIKKDKIESTQFVLVDDFLVEFIKKKYNWKTDGSFRKAFKKLVNLGAITKTPYRGYYQINPDYAVKQVKGKVYYVNF